MCVKHLVFHGKRAWTALLITTYIRLVQSNALLRYEILCQSSVCQSSYRRNASMQAHWHPCTVDYTLSTAPKSNRDPISVRRIQEADALMKISSGSSNISRQIYYDSSSMTVTHPIYPVPSSTVCEEPIRQLAVAFKKPLRLRYLLSSIVPLAIYLTSGTGKLCVHKIFE